MCPSLHLASFYYLPSLCRPTAINWKESEITFLQWKKCCGFISAAALFSKTFYIHTCWQKIWVDVRRSSVCTWELHSQHNVWNVKRSSCVSPQMFSHVFLQESPIFSVLWGLQLSVRSRVIVHRNSSDCCESDKTITLCLNTSSRQLENLLEIIEHMSFNVHQNRQLHHVIRSHVTSVTGVTTFFFALSSSFRFHDSLSVFCLVHLRTSVTRPALITCRNLSVCCFPVLWAPGRRSWTERVCPWVKWLFRGDVLKVSH